MKKTVQNILFLIIGVIYMCIAVIPLVYFYAIYQGDFDYHNYQILVKKIFSFQLFIFIYMFLSINFLILGLNLFLNNKIEKIFSIKRIIYIAIILYLFLSILMTHLFPYRIFLW